MVPEVLMRLIMVFFDCRFLQSAVHSLDLAVCPGVVRLGQPVLDAMLVADPVEQVNAVSRGRAGAVPGQIGELDSVVGENRVDPVGNDLDERLQESRRDFPGCLLAQLGMGELAGPVDGDEQIEPAFLGTNLGNINVEIADGIRLEPLLRSVPRHIRQPAHAVTLQTAVQTGAGQLWDRRL